MTLTTPVGGPSPSPPGLTTQNSRSRPGPPGPRKSCSWLFLSLKMDRMTVDMRMRKTMGAWLAESPAPIDVTIAILAVNKTRRQTNCPYDDNQNNQNNQKREKKHSPSLSMPAAFMALMTFVVPSVSMVAPTSFVLPPRETTMPVVSFVMTLATSAASETLPRTTVRLGSESGVPSAAPPVPGGVVIFEGSRARTVTLAPRLSAWTTHSEPVPPVPPRTTTLLDSAGVALATIIDFEDRATRLEPGAARARTDACTMLTREESADVSGADIVMMIDRWTCYR